MRSRLFTRLALSITLLLTFSLLTLGYLLLEDAQKKFLHERQQQVKGQVVTLANGSLDGLIARDYELLENWLKSVMPADFYAYAFLSSPTGKIISHTDLSQIGHDIAFMELDAALIRQKTYHNRLVEEVIHPVKIGNKHLANAHLAYYLDDTSFYSDAAAFDIILVLTLFLLILLTAVLLIVKHFLKPITDLTHIITATSLGAARDNPLDPWLLKRDDEIGTLAREFQNMIVRLRDSYTALQNEETRLRKMVEKKTFDLQQANKELEAFSHSISHDLRAPLRAINGFSQALSEDYGQTLDETAQGYIERINKGALRMEQLIAALLKLSRIQRSELNKRRVNLGDLARTTIQRLREQYPTHNVEIHIGEGLVVNGDKHLLSVMLENLIGNAWKYSAKKAQPRIEFFAQEENGETLYCVRDNGAGFDMRLAKDKLFGTFQRLHSSREFEGSGIGLATVQRIITLHEGHIWAESEVSKGACFYFALPV
ncbi:MAG: ATP-binding protein [Gammaproteobacteria bacterium]|nr:ATP-binding protein [Gammaproteobacteria bacterium]